MTHSKAPKKPQFVVVRRIQSPKGLQCIVEVDGDWILRAVGLVCRVSKDFQAKWKVEIAGESPAMMLPTVVDKGRVFTVTKSAAGKYSLIALDAAEGGELWQVGLSWKGENIYGGLVAHKGRIFLHKEVGGMIPQGIVLDAKDGKEVGTLPEWPTNPIGKGIGVFDPAFVHEGNYVFSAVQGGRAFRLGLGDANPAFSPIEGLQFPLLDAVSNNLVIRGKREEEFFFFQTDPKTLKEQARFPYQPVKDQLGLLKELRICSKDLVLVIAERGMGGLSFSKNQIVWEYKFGDAAAQCMGGVLMDDSFLFIEIGATYNDLVELNWRTGKLIARTPAKDLFLQYRMFAMGDQVVVEGVASYVVLARRSGDFPLPEPEALFQGDGSSSKSTTQKSSAEDADQAYSTLINTFIEAKVAMEQGKNHKPLAKAFNVLFDRFVEVYPSASLAGLAVTLSELGVPYERAFGDLIAMRGIG